MLLKMQQLTPAETGQNIGHAVVVARVFVLVPGRRFSGLGGPFSGQVRSSLIVGQQHTAAGSGDDLIAVKANGVVFTQGAAGTAMICSRQGFRRIFNQHRIMLFADRPDRIHLGRNAIEVNQQNDLGIGVLFKGLFQ